MSSTMRRILATAGLAVLLGAGVAGCSNVVPKDEVGTRISEELGKQGITATAVTCPEDLPAEVGGTVRCEFTADGKPVGATATVTSRQGEQALFDLVWEHPVLPADLIGSSVDEELVALQVAADGPSSCPNALVGAPGNTIRCEFTAGDQPVDAVATVAGVKDGEPDLDVELQARPVAAQLLAQRVAELVSEVLQVPVEGAECEGDLAPEEGESVVCTVSDGVGSIDVRATVTSVVDGLVSFEIADV